MRTPHATAGAGPPSGSGVAVALAAGLAPTRGTASAGGGDAVPAAAIGRADVSATDAAGWTDPPRDASAAADSVQAFDGTLLADTGNAPVESATGGGTEAPPTGIPRGGGGLVVPVDLAPLGSADAAPRPLASVAADGAEAPAVNEAAVAVLRRGLDAGGTSSGAADGPLDVAQDPAPPSVGGVEEGGSAPAAADAAPPAVAPAGAAPPATDVPPAVAPAGTAPPAMDVPPAAAAAPADDAGTSPEEAIAPADTGDPASSSDPPPYRPPPPPEELGSPTEPSPGDVWVRAWWASAIGDAGANRMADVSGWSWYVEGVSLDGAGGDDTLWGGDGLNPLRGGTGNDFVMGRGGSDTLWGGDGDDALLGGEARDTLSGDAGADTLAGGGGGDLLDGGAGDDLLFGGDGADDFGFGAGHDTVADYDPGQDRLSFSFDVSEVVVRAVGGGALVTVRNRAGDVLDDTLLLHGAVLSDGRLAVRHIFAPEARIVLEGDGGVVQPAGGYYYADGLSVNGVEVAEGGGGEFAWYHWQPITITLGIVSTSVTVAAMPVVVAHVDPL